MNIKNTLAVLGLAVFIMPSPTHAQTQFGLEGGLNIASQHISPPASAFSSNITVSSLIGGKIGGVVAIPVGKNIYLEPGLFFSMKGVDASGSGVEIKYMYDYFEVPFFVEYHIKHFIFGAGPYIAYAVHANGKETNIGQTVTQNFQIGNDATDAIKATDAGINLKAKYQFSGGWFFSLQYGLGLSNVNPVAGIIEKNRVFCISTGYMFGHRKPKHEIGVPVYKTIK